MKRILFFVLMLVSLSCLLAFSVSAEENSVHNGRVDLDASVTVDGQEMNLFDDDGNALIWFISGQDENGKNVYSSIRADIGVSGDNKVDFQVNSWAITAPRITQSK